MIHYIIAAGIGAFLGSQSKKSKKSYAHGGEVDYLEYSEIFDVLKDKIDDAVEDISSTYDQAYDSQGEEVEHESRSGFIPYTNGGYSSKWFEYINMLSGSGTNLPTSVLDKEMQRQVDYIYELAKDRFVEENEELVKEIGEDKVNYHDLNELGYGDEAESLSEMENDMGDDSILMQVEAMYYAPHNDRGIDGKNTIRLSGSVNLEAPYHRRGNLDDYIESEFTFNSVEELETKMDSNLKKVIGWFEGDNYSESKRELKIRRMAKGGALSSDTSDVYFFAYEEFMKNGKKFKSEKELYDFVNDGYAFPKYSKKSVKSAFESLNKYEYAKGGKVKPVKLDFEYEGKPVSFSFTPESGEYRTHYDSDNPDERFHIDYDEDYEYISVSVYADDDSEAEEVYGQAIKTEDKMFYLAKGGSTYAKGGSVEKINSILEKIEDGQRFILSKYHSTRKLKDGTYEIMTAPKNEDEGDLSKGVRLKTYKDYSKFKNAVIRHLKSPTSRINSKFAKGGVTPHYNVIALEHRHNLQYGDSQRFATEKEAIEWGMKQFKSDDVGLVEIDRVRENGLTDMVFRINDTYPLGERVVMKPYAKGGRVRYMLNGFEERINYILDSTNGVEVAREGSLEDGDLVIYFETKDDYEKGGKTANQILSFSFNLDNVSLKQIVEIVEIYTKDWRTSGDISNVNMHVTLSKSKAHELELALKGEDVYDIERRESRFAKGGQTIPPITNYHKNIMGTLSFDLKVKGMRKPQDFIVYPIREKTDTISIQSDKKFGEINILTGKGILSKSGSAMYHLSLDKARSNVNEFQLSKGEVQELKTQIKSTTGKSVGGSFVKSDNSAADLLEKGGKVRKKVKK